MRVDLRGFSLMEILVAMVLLGAISAVAFSSFSSGVKISQSKNNIALNVARASLENFHEYVRADQWATPGSQLSPTAPGPQPAPQTLNSVTYTPAYTVAAVDVDGDGVEDYRRVDMQVSW